MTEGQKIKKKENVNMNTLSLCQIQHGVIWRAKGMF